MLPLVLLAAILPPPAAQPDFTNVLRDVLRDCRAPSDGTVIVCGRRDGTSPYRLPLEARDPGFDVDGPVDSVARERHKLMEVGDSGPGLVETDRGEEGTPPRPPPRTAPSRGRMIFS